MISAAHALEVYHAMTLQELQAEEAILQLRYKNYPSDYFRTMLRIIQIVINLKQAKQ